MVNVWLVRVPEAAGREMKVQSVTLSTGVSVGDTEGDKVFEEQRIS